MATKKSSPKKKAAKKSIVKKGEAKKTAGRKAPAAKQNFTRARALMARTIDTASDVKTIIIANSPLSGLEISDLTDDMTLKGNLSYEPQDFKTLNISLDAYVNNRDASQHITATDMNSCTAVGNTISKVKTKLHEA